MRLLTNMVDRVIAWRERHTGSPAFYYVVASCIGVLSGLAAAALKHGINFTTQTVFSLFKIHQGNWGFLLLPVGGIFLAVLVTKYIARAPLDHATERIADDLANNNGNLSGRLIWGSLIGCSFTLGMGGSAGAESPIAYVGASVGSTVGRKLKLSQESIQQLVGCGAAAGIAGIYMAPIGGVMFAIEVLRMRQNLQTVVAMTFSSLAAALTCYLLMGCHTDVSFVPEMRFDLHKIPYVLLCGAFCGLYSLYYIYSLKTLRKWLSRVGNRWLKALYGGLVLAALLFLFPSLYGEGYDTIGKLMDNDPISIISYSPLYRFGKDFILLMVLFLVLLLVKPFATSATNDSGGVGGDFTPTFFCGGVLGFLFAAVVNHFWHLDLPYALFAFFGMAAVMSGAQHAPLMAIFITAEMTGLYGFILPLTLAAVASFVTTALIDKRQIPLLLGKIERTSDQPVIGVSEETSQQPSQQPSQQLSQQTPQQTPQQPTAP